MTISRRSALKQLFIVAGGVIFVPACFHHKDKSSLTLRHFSLEADQQETLEALADTLLPANASPSDATMGAKAVGAHLFVLKMMDDCYPEGQQQQFMKGLVAFDQQAHRQYGKSFGGCDPKQREEMVGALEGDAAGQKDFSKQSDLLFFYRENKKLLIRGYLGSQYFLTKIEVYELVPGRWHGCSPLIKKS